MKKFLLFVAAAAMIGSASAQFLDNKAEVVPVRERTEVKEIRQAAPLKVMGYKNAAKKSSRAFEKSARPAMSMVAMPKELQNLPVLSLPQGLKAKPVTERPISMASQAASAALKEAYVGSGFSYDIQNKTLTPFEDWSVVPGVVEFPEGKFNCIYDLLPPGLFDEPLEFLYKEENGQLIFPVMGLMDYKGGQVCYMDYTDFSTGGNGSIVLDLAEDGTLSVPADRASHMFMYALCAFDPETYEPTELMTYFDIIVKLSYSAFEDPFVSEASYTGKGKDLASKMNLTWTMELGKVEDLTVIRNIAPSVFGETPMDVVATVNENVITVAPQKIYEEVDGEDAYYLYLASASSEDGVITITKDPATGYLTLPEGEGVFTGWFTVDAFDPEFGDTYDGYEQITDKVKFYAEGQEIPTPAPDVYADATTSGLLYFGMDANGSYYNYALAPAFVDFAFRNYTKDEVTSFRWEGEVIDYDSELKEFVVVDKIQSADTTLVIPTEPGDSYRSISLFGINGDKESDPSVIGYDENTVIEVGGMGGTFEETELLTTYNISNGLAAYTNWGTPDLNSESVSKICMYGFKPTAPLYFTGISVPMVGFTQVEDKEFALTAKIVKPSMTAAGKFALGDVIAQCDATIENVDDQFAAASGISVVSFNNFYVYDEDGMTVELDHLFLDEEFWVVLDGWDNGTFSARLICEDSPNDYAPVSTRFETTEEPGAFYAYSGWATKLYYGFENATYGYLYTEDNTSLTIDAEGGEAKIKIEPMLVRKDEEGNVKTNLSLEDELPEWLTLDIEDEVYSEEEASFVLKVTAEALAEGETGRQAQFRVYQPGAYLDITVTQGEVTGIKTVVKRTVNGGKCYNLAGEHVAEGTKGIVVKSNVKSLNK